MKTTLSRFMWAVLTVLTLTACESAEGGSDLNNDNKPALETQIQKGSYAIGYQNGAGLREQTQGVLDVDAFVAGMKAALAEQESQVSDEDAQVAIGSVVAAVEAKAQAAAAANSGEADAFRAEFAAKEGVTTLPSGLMYEVINEGEGAKPTLQDTVTTHYHGTLIDGSVFDSSVDRGTPASFPVSGVIRGWTEALQLMSVGSKWRLVIPPDLAYGDRGAGGLIGPNETLVFEVELLEIN